MTPGAAARADVLLGAWVGKMPSFRVSLAVVITGDKPDPLDVFRPLHFAHFSWVANGSKPPGNTDASEMVSSWAVDKWQTSNLRR